MPDVFRRAYRLSIEIDGKLKTYQELTNTNESLKVDFNITNCVYGVSSERKFLHLPFSMLHQ